MTVGDDAFLGDCFDAFAFCVNKFDVRPVERLQVFVVGSMVVCRIDYNRA